MASICPRCQASNQDEVTFCYRCGTRLDQPTDTIVAGFGPRRSSAAGGRNRLLLLVLAGAGLICLVAVVVVAIMLVNRDNGVVVPTATLPPTATETPTPFPATTLPPATPLPPLPAATTQTPTITPSPTVSLPTETPLPTPNQYGLRVGLQVRVYTTEGDQLRMRDAPGVHGTIVTALSKGTLVYIIDGPISEVGGYTWWKVQTGDAKVGWCVEYIDGIQTLQP